VKWVFENIADNQGGFLVSLLKKDPPKKISLWGYVSRISRLGRLIGGKGRFSYRQERLLKEPEEATEGQWRRQRKQSLTKTSKS
jgi:hypothetical protein